MSYIDMIRTTTSNKVNCANCGKPAECAHHETPRSEGGADTADNLRPLCFKCHRITHATKGDWQRWGQRGGKVTASNPYNYMRNLRQYRSWSNDKLSEYVRTKYGMIVSFDPKRDAFDDDTWQDRNSRFEL